MIEMPKARWLLGGPGYDANQSKEALQANAFSPAS